MPLSCDVSEVHVQAKLSKTVEEQKQLGGEHPVRLLVQVVKCFPHVLPFFDFLAGG